MALLLVSIAGFFVSGLLATVTSLPDRTSRTSLRIAVWGALLFSVFGIAGALQGLLNEGADRSVTTRLGMADLFAVGLDPLSAWFLLPIFLLAPLVSVAASSWLDARPGRGRGHWLFFHTVVAAMALVVLARSSALLIVAWETMALATYALLRLGKGNDGAETAASVKASGAIAWLVASQLGTVALFALFLLEERPGGARGSIFLGEHGLTSLLLALAGFGAQAALVPFQSWASLAYGRAPGHLSALLAGAMSKLGIYGILRYFLATQGSPAGPAAVSPTAVWLLLAIGTGSMLVGALTAARQRDLRRILAATSTASTGLIACGIAVALLGLRVEANSVAVLALAAALLHVLQDAAFTGLLFASAGTIVEATGSDRLELHVRSKAAPAATPIRTGLFLLVGAAGVLALPPFNGLPSRLLLVTGVVEGATAFPAGVAAPLFVVLLALALSAGLTLAAMVRALRATRKSRSTAPLPFAEPTRTALLIPLVPLAALCLLFGLFTPLLLEAMRPVVAQLLGDPRSWEWCWRHHALAAAGGGAIAACVFGVLFAVLAWLARSRGWPLSSAVGIACAGLLVALVPIGGIAMPIAFPGDLVLLAALLATARFAAALQAPENEKRSVRWAACVDAALLLGLAALARVSLQRGVPADAGPPYSLASFLRGVDAQAWRARGIELALVTTSLLLAVFSERRRDKGRLPAARLWAFGALIANLVVPVRSGRVVLDAAAGLVGIAVIVIGVEFATARLESWRALRSRHLAIAAAACALVAAILSLR